MTTTLRPPHLDGTTAINLLAASQPDIVRASQKDDSYVEQYVEATREVVRRLFGPFRTLQFARETKLLAMFLYHGLTTGLGSSTLGEEYCGLLQVTADGHAPGPVRRLLLAALLSAGPYAADRLAGRLDNAAEEAAGAEVVAEAAQDLGLGDGAESMPFGGHEPSPTTAGGSEAGDSEAEAETEQEDRRCSGRHACGGPGSSAASASAAAAAARWDGFSLAWLHALVAAAAARWSRIWRGVVRAWPRARPLLSYAGRVHLALFYLYGAYYSLPHRLAGVRYSLAMRPLQGRPSYRFLGLLLGLQLAVTAAGQLRGALRRMAAARAAAAKAADGAGSAAAGGRRRGAEQRYAEEGEPAVFLEEDLEDPLSDWDEEGGSEGEAEEEGAHGGGGDHGGGQQAGVEGAGLGEADEEEEDGASAGWETAVFGAKPSRPMPPDAQQQRHPAHAAGTQRQVRERAAGAGTCDGDTATGRGQETPRRRDRRLGGSGGVLPVLTSLRQCPLCLSPKSHPASTPCGHTFCWACITTWCMEKPECPLCRSDVRPQQLVALYHTNC